MISRTNRWCFQGPRRPVHTHSGEEILAASGREARLQTEPQPASERRFPTRCSSEPRPPRTGEQGWKQQGNHFIFGWKFTWKSRSLNTIFYQMISLICTDVTDEIKLYWLDLLLWRISSISTDVTYLSSHVRQCTSIGRIPDPIRLSIGGLRSLDSNFLEETENINIYFKL